MISLNGRNVHFGKFPNNETYADMSYSVYGPVKDVNTIFFKFEDDTDIFHLIAVKDFVDQNYGRFPTELIMPYVPYSRMDRKENDRLFTLKTFANIINGMGFYRVVVDEPHSDVSVALINNVEVQNISSNMVIKAMCDMFNVSGSCWYSNDYKHVNVYGEPDVCIDALFIKAKSAGVYIVYPDSGAEKRYSKQIEYPNILTCRKKRDFDTGKINRIIVDGIDDVNNCKVAIIVDDLSSRGGTFMGVASELRKNIPGLEKVILCVTHCENSIYMGNVFKDNSPIDVVYATESLLKDPYYLYNNLNTDDCEEIIKCLQDEGESLDVFKERIRKIIDDQKLYVVSKFDLYM